jgi:hypothetical protein
MTAAAAFQATYSDWRIIKGRKVVQIVFEVPLEGEGLAYQVLGGMPDPSKSVWCGIARLKSGPTEEPATVATEKSSHVERGGPESHPPAARGDPREGIGDGVVTPEMSAIIHQSSRNPDKRLAKQAGMACADPLFRRFINGGLPNGCSQEEAAEQVRLMCGVKSRSEIVWGTPAGDAWDKLWSRYLAWRETA